MLNLQNVNYKLVDIGELCDLKLNCCYLEWKRKIYFCSNSYRLGNELIIHGEDGEEVISIKSETTLFILLESKDEDDNEVYRIIEVVE